MELRGNLKDFSLPDIIQLVGFGRKTGVLRVECDEAEAALYFDQGMVVHAEYPGAVGEEAVFSLFHVPEGEFRFQGAEPPDARTITMDPTNLVMEAARLLDESRRDGEEEETWSPSDAELDGDWLEIEDEAPVARREPEDVKREAKTILTRRFGRRAKRLLEAVDRCGDSVEDLLDLSERIEKYVHVFLDEGAAEPVGTEIRSLVSSLDSPAS